MELDNLIEQIGFATTFEVKFLGELLEKLVEKMEPNLPPRGINPFHPYTTQSRDCIKFGESKYPLISRRDRVLYLMKDPIITFNWLVDEQNQKSFITIGKRHIKKLVAEGKNFSAIFVSNQQFKDRPYIKEFIRYFVQYRIENDLRDITEQQVDEALACFLVDQQKYEDIYNSFVTWFNQYSPEEKQKVLKKYGFEISNPQD